ncbi:ABC transporter permease [Roseomonas sp. AR75]|uniref:ABC transporter permease n=1 Tax=Roseomonas sp. AR75 TaxID=2562311 RepID=UPI0010BF9D8E|nr:ABC transporter permease [Roseomonas sp. AR75]
MRLVLEARERTGLVLRLAAPLLAVALTVVSAVLVFLALGLDPLEALRVYFVAPVSDAYGLQEVAVKATPLVLIACGLSLCYRSNNWNIGAEGQFLAGAMAGGWLAIATHGAPDGPWLLPAMLLLGALGGALYALIPAALKTRFGANEILTSLMLVYVAELLLDWLVRGPWRDPQGFNMPVTVGFEPEALVPPLIEGGRLGIGAPIALLVVLLMTLVLRHTLAGFRIRLVGEAPRAARFAGFSTRRMTWAVFAISGGLAGLAGILEAAGTVQMLQPGLSPGYGFTAIIVAFLGRLTPVGCLVAGLFIAVTFIGGENAQIVLGLPLDVTRVFQGMLLFYVLACDTLLTYRPRIVRGAAA